MIKVLIKNKKGLHARVAAMVVHKAAELQKKYNVQLYLYKNDKRISATSLMPLVLLKIKQNEIVLIEGVGESTKLAISEMAEFLQGDFSFSDEETINDVDNIIHSNTIAWEQIYRNIENGLMVIDENDIITIFNYAAEKILKISANEAVGKKVYDIIPDTKLHVVKKTGKAKIGLRKVIGDSIIIMNHTPIIVEEKIKGAVALFQDISKIEQLTGELKEVKELKEGLQLVLDSVQDGICVLDEQGYITYINSPYLNIIHEKQQNVLGKNIKDISKTGLRKEVLESGENKKGVLRKKSNGASIVADVSAIKVDGEIRGVVSVVKDLTETQKLLESLNKASAKAQYLEEELLRTKRPNETFKKFIGNSGKVIDALAIAAKAAESYATVLIRGESGTGKEVISEGIHFASLSSKGSFVRVNCAAIPPNLLESELFGHEKGAFTGAIKRKLGKFELANKGTIFLDEIGELDKSMQAKILRVLQEKEFQRVGGEENIKVNVRIIAATNRNLEQMVRNGEFREDLYYRLNVIPIFLPPLRERIQDIPLLVEHFIKKISKDMNKQIKGVKEECLEALMNYSWPGNVRELQNIIERMVTLTDDYFIKLQDLPMYIRDKSIKNSLLTNNNKKLNSEISQILDDENILPLEEYEKIIIKKALKKYGSYNAAAKVLGVTHKTVAAKARKYGIEKDVVWKG
ncbi:sigma 54-interacting transcriptional regulator [Haloimpatiens sp. FM7330]|uniref:sigma 54-interacting transcriptional regulator n=1 Tax=Haloimpatiens sp. FM7330 TaxID=3298610 RepID=UPI00362F5286